MSRPTLPTRLATLLLAALPLAAAAQWLAAPYKDVSLHADPAAPRITVQRGSGAPRPLPDAALHGGTVVWAFATGACGQERWGDFDSVAFAAINVAAFVAAGVDYIVSTGGEAGAFQCDSDQGMERFVAHYDSPRLVGLDFDIERQQSAAQIDALVQRALAAQQRRPRLRISFTLATHAASDGSQRSLNATGETVLAALRRHRLDSAVINLMVMNFGAAEPRWCVVAAGRCDMGASALQAARNVQAKYGVPADRIALTPMLGINDVQANVFGPADARVLVEGARALGLAGVHHWSLDRDQPCAADEPAVSPRCHGLAGVAPGAFAAILDGAVR